MFDHNLPAGRSQTLLDFSSVPLPLGADQSEGYKSSIFCSQPRDSQSCHEQKGKPARFQRAIYQLSPFYLIVEVGDEGSDVWRQPDPDPSLF